MSRIVAHVIEHLQLGGIESLVLSCLRHQDAYIISLQGNKLPLWVKDINIPDIEDRIIFLDKQGFSLKTAYRLAEALKKYNISCLHSHHIGPLLYATLARSLYKCQHIHTEHDAWHLTDNFQHIKLQNLLLRLAKPEYIADSQHVRHELSKTIDYPCDVITNGVDTQKFKAKLMIGKKLDENNTRLNLNLTALLKSRQDAIILGCAGRLEKVKNHKFLIKLMMHLPDNYLLLIAGSGSLQQQLARTINQHNLGGRVKLLGHITDMVAFYNAIDVLCLPSLNEGLPLSILEAQTVGTPCLVSAVGGCKEAVIAPHSKLLPVNNIQRWLHAINKFNIHKKQTLHTKAKKGFSLQTMIGRYSSL
jgi:glycosyltransferase involved in cell wall biosynthesis